MMSVVNMKSIFIETRKINFLLLVLATCHISILHYRGQATLRKPGVQALMSGTV